MTSGYRMAAEVVEKENAELRAELLSAKDARTLLEDCVRLQNLVAYAVTALTAKIHDAAEVARLTGSSIPKARSVVATGEAMASSEELSSALAKGSISLDQAAEIAPAVKAAPGAAAELVAVAETEAFHVLRDEARRTKLEAEQHHGLAERQRKARTASSHTDELGMVHLHVVWEPHVGAPLVARVEAEAERLARSARARAKERAEARGERYVGGAPEPFGAYLADAFAAMLTGSASKGRAKRPELVVLVSHEITQRGWDEVRAGEVCKIPGVGPISPQVARDIAQDAFLNGVFYDGKDLRHFKRFGRDAPKEVQVALELGAAPDFDGVKCVDCARRFKTEFDHLQPVHRQGPSSHPNLQPRCWECHRAKSERERKQRMAARHRARPPGRRPGRDGEPRLSNNTTGGHDPPQ